MIGHTRISTAVIADLVERGVPIHFHSHAGAMPQSLVGHTEGQVEALRTQVQASRERRLSVARALVTAKIVNCVWVLKRIHSSVSLLMPDISVMPGENELRGAEGYAARQYFSALASVLSGWSFSGRAYTDLRQIR